MTTPLTPAAQAVLDAYETADCDPYKIDPRQAGLAAALRAAAEQPYEVPPWYRGDDYLIFRDAVTTERNRLFAIAKELGPTP
jgi:hypothetical protein